MGVLEPMSPIFSPEVIQLSQQRHFSRNSYLPDALMEHSGVQARPLPVELHQIRFLTYRTGHSAKAAKIPCLKENSMLKKSTLLRLLVNCLLFFCLLPIGYSYGFETRGQECSKCHTLNGDEAWDLLINIIPDVVILDVRLSPVKGFWEVYLESRGRKAIIYVDFLKKHFFSGALVSIGEKKNLTQERFIELNKVNVSQIPLENALVMGDEKARIRVIVFTDPDCPFCSKLHQEMKKVIEERKDIVFYIKLFPLKNQPGTYEKSKSILCEKSLALLENAFEKKPIPKPKCETSAVDENMKLAKKLGIMSVPSVILPDGRIIPGYKDAKTLINLIGN
jgi:thiol:disulfide interchange protein DsbC